MKLLAVISPYLVAIVLVGLCLFLAYEHGVSVTTDHYETELSKRDAASKESTLQAVEKARKEERVSAADMVAIDREHQEKLRNEIEIRDRTIADLRAGALRLRKRFTCSSSASGILSGASGSAGIGDEASQGGFQGADVEFLIGEADRADQVAIQLQECQEVVRKDRVRGKGNVDE